MVMVMVMVRVRVRVRIRVRVKVKGQSGLGLGLGSALSPSALLINILRPLEPRVSLTSNSRFQDFNNSRFQDGENGSLSLSTQAVPPHLLKRS